MWKLLPHQKLTGKSTDIWRCFFISQAISHDDIMLLCRYVESSRVGQTLVSDPGKIRKLKTAKKAHEIRAQMWTVE